MLITLEPLGLETKSVLWSHPKTPNVVISYTVVFVFLQTLQFSWKSNPIIFRPCQLKNMEIKLISQTFLNEHEQICQRALQSGHEAISLQRFSVFKPNLVGDIITMTWEYLHSFGTTPPSGQKMWKIALFANNFLTVWHKITRMVTRHSERQNGTQFPHVHHFWCRPFRILSQNARFYKLIGASLQNYMSMCFQHHTLMVLKTFGSTTYW